MATFELPYFGNIRMDSVDECYFEEVKFGERTIYIDVNFMKSETDALTLESVKDFILKISQLNELNAEHYKSDFANGGETVNFILFYIEELPEEQLMELIDTSKSIDNQKLELLNKLELRRVGLYPDLEPRTELFGVFDYSIKIDGEYCDQLLVVKTDENGEIDHIAWES